MSECLRCRNCAPLEPLPKGDPLRLHRGQWGMLARGLAYCGLKLPEQSYQRFRSLTASSSCPYFERVQDDERIAARRSMAKRLQRDYAAWINERRERGK